MRGKKIKNVKTGSIAIILAGFIGVFSYADDSFVQKVNAREPQAVKSDTSRINLDFKAIDLHGKPFTALRLKGKTVLLDFWAVWCAPCIAAFPTLTKLNRDLKDQNFQVVGVAVYSGTHEDVRTFLEKHKLDYTVVVGDEDLAGRFGVIGFPTYFLISPDGTVQKKYVGEAKNLYDDVKKEVLALRNAAKPRKKRGI
ncbi:MAG: TlpA disulfide reductase family protein [bacterium]